MENYYLKYHAALNFMCLTCTKCIWKIFAKNCTNIWFVAFEIEKKSRTANNTKSASKNILDFVLHSVNKVFMKHLKQQTNKQEHNKKQY